MSHAGLRRELGLASLLAVVFFNVSGGPYGIEDAVSSFGPGLTLVLLVLTPLVWSLPVSLAMAELAAALPEEGGYVAWVRRAFGPFWGFQVGLVELDQLLRGRRRVPGALRRLREVLVARHVGRGALGGGAGFVWALTGLNLAGVRVTGRSAVALGVGALVPVAVFTVMAGHARRARAVDALRRRRGRASSRASGSGSR